MHQPQDSPILGKLFPRSNLASMPRKEESGAGGDMAWGSWEGPTMCSALPLTIKFTQSFLLTPGPLSHCMPPTLGAPLALPWGYT